MAIVKVEGTEYYRDTNTMALVNKDNAAKDEYLLKRKLLNNQQTELNNVRKEIDSIKQNIEEIKSLLLSTINFKR